jgi:capsular exopolysaccharide synthesis family protein
MNPEANEAPDLRDYLRLVWRRGWILLACMILIPLALYEYTASKPKLFESTTVLQVQAGADPSVVGSADFAPSSTNIDLIAAIVSTSAVSDEAARSLGLPAGSLRGAAQGSADPDTGFITITATASTAQRSAQVATAFANALSATRKEQDTKRLNSAIDTVQKTLQNTPKSDIASRTQLRTQLQKLLTLKQAQGQNAQIVEPARAGAQIAPHPKRNATVGLVLAILIGAALISMAERMDRRIHKPDELERLTGLPFLATIPQEAFPGTQSTAEVHEAFQTLRSSLTYFNADQQLRTLLVVSGLKGEGKTTVASNLAAAYAASGKRVLLVDADLRKPDAAERLGVGDPAGLSQVLAGAVTLHDALQEVPPFGDRLRVLPAGAVPPNPSALLGSQRMARLIGELEAEADLVVIDSTPLLAVSDAFPLLDKASGIVGLIRLDKTPRDAIRRMLKIVDSAGGNILGLVATDDKRRMTGGFGYGYGYGEEKRKKPATDQIFVPPGAAEAADGGGSNGTPARVPNEFESDPT